MTTHLAYDAADDAWQATYTVPAGSWLYKAALNNGWDENYGANAAPGGLNLALTMGAAQPVKFYYSHETHWITDTLNAVIATVPGSFQSELGCPGDWQPDCLRSWLQDPDGDGIYSFSTTSIPAGSYEGKVALNEGWDVNYGQGGVQGGDNYGFTVPANGKVTFSYDATTHALAITAASLDPTQDNNVEWDGLRHDSRDTLYRTPGGAVPDGTAVTIRFRTLHNDVSGVKVRFYSVDRGGAELVKMTRAASGVGCYQTDLAARTCDFWQATLPADFGPDNLWYRFVVTDGTDTDSYGDDTAALDGGLGKATDDPVDQSWALMIHEKGFTAPAWAKNAVIYQIFPDRFRNGRADNDPKTGDVRYDDPVIKLTWGQNPEGYCRNYTDATTSCPWRFDVTPPADSPTREQPRGRDYFGGDLKGVDQQLDYLKALGVNTVYFNPIFDAGSNHAYDTQDYRKIDPSFGTQKDWTNLVKHAKDRGIRIVLDGVFNTWRPTARSSIATTTSRARVRASRRARRSAPGSSSVRSVRARAPAPGPAAARRLPTRAGSASTPSRSSTRPPATRRSGTTSSRARMPSRSSGCGPAPPAGGWTCQVTPRSRPTTGRPSARSSSRPTPRP